MMMKLFIKVMRGVPASTMVSVWVALLIAGIMGGIYRVGAWVLGLQLALPAFGLLSLLWVIVTCAIRRRIDPLERFSLAMAVLSIALLVPFELDAWLEGQGLLQRGFFLSTMAWVEVTSLRLFRLAGARAY